MVNTQKNHRLARHVQWQLNHACYVAAAIAKRWLIIVLVGLFTSIAQSELADGPADSVTVPDQHTSASSPAPGDNATDQKNNSANNHKVKDGSVNENSSDNVDSTGHEQKELRAFHSALKEFEEYGPYYYRSAEVLYGLAKALQNQGSHQQALEIFQQSMHINRVNDGLSGLSQAPMLRGIIGSQKALHLFEEVTLNYRRLLNLFFTNNRRTDLALITALKELAIWHVDVYQLDKSRSRVDHLTSAHGLINLAINSANEVDDLDTATRIDLLETAALVSLRTSWHEGDDWISVHDSQYSASVVNKFIKPTRMATLSKTSFRSGRLAHEQIIALCEADADIDLDQKISAYVGMGDWYLLFNHRSKAMQYYHQAHQLITEAGQPQLTEYWFGEPVFIPVLSSDRADKNPITLYVKAQLDISENGRTSKISIIEPLAEGNRAVRRAASKAIKKSRFRPRFINGEAVNSEGVVVSIPLIH